MRSLPVILALISIDANFAFAQDDAGFDVYTPLYGCEG